MRSVPLKLLMTLCALLPAAGAFAQARLDFLHPVAGGTMEIVVDQIPPDAEVLLALGSAGAVPARADASGTARFRYDVPASGAGKTFEFIASIETGEVAVSGVTIDLPQLLVTTDVGGRGRLVRVAAGGEDGRTFAHLATRDLGPGLPGGAVRDGQRTKTFVVADREEGWLAVIPDDPSGFSSRHPLAPDVRDIALTPDGRFVLVTSAGNDDAESVLAVFDARTGEPSEHLSLEPLGRHGGRIVVTDDGLRAFVSVQGLYLLEVDLLRRELGDLVGVGGPGQDEIKDLRLVDGRIFALTGRSDSVGYVTGLDTSDLRDARLSSPTRTEPRLGVARIAGEMSLLLLDGAQGTVTVLDAATMHFRDTFSVPAGAEALLFSPNPARSTGELLYPRDGGTYGVLVDFESASLGVERQYDGRLSLLPVHGTATRIDLYFARAADGSLVLIEPDTLAPLSVPPLDGLVVHAISVAD